MEVELRSCQSTCLVSFLIRLAHKALCSEKLDQQLYEKLWTPAVFAASASFYSWNSSSLWLPYFASLYFLEANLCLSPGTCSDTIGHAGTMLQRYVTGALTFFFFPFLFFFLNFILFLKLYIIVLVLPNIKMNPPPVYMCSPSWTLLPPRSPYHPSGSSQCTSPKHPVSCIEPGLASRFIHDILVSIHKWGHIVLVFPCLAYFT